MYKMKSKGISELNKGEVAGLIFSIIQGFIIPALR